MKKRKAHGNLAIFPIYMTVMINFLDNEIIFFIFYCPTFISKELKKESDQLIKELKGGKRKQTDDSKEEKPESKSVVAMVTRIVDPTTLLLG